METYRIEAYQAKVLAMLWLIASLLAWNGGHNIGAWIGGIYSATKAIESVIATMRNRQVMRRVAAVYKAGMGNDRTVKGFKN